MFGASASAPAPTDGHYCGFVMPSVFDVSGLKSLLSQSLAPLSKTKREALVSWDGRCSSIHMGQSCPVLREEIPVNAKQIRVGIVGADTKASWAKVSHVPA